MVLKRTETNKPMLYLNAFTKEDTKFRNSKWKKVISIRVETNKIKIKKLKIHLK